MAKFSLQKIGRDGVIMLRVCDNFVGAFVDGVNAIHFHKAVSAVPRAFKAVVFKSMVQSVKSHSGITPVQGNKLS